MKRKDLNTLLDRAIDEVRALTPAAEDESASAHRVWERLAQEWSGAGRVGNGRVTEPSQESAARALTQSEPLSSPADYLALIPDYLVGRLSPARALLLEEEARRSIPLRRALAEARSKARSSAEVLPGTLLSKPEPAAWPRWLAAAAVLVLVSVSAYWLTGSFRGQGEIAQVRSVAGSLYRVTDLGLEPLRAGDWIDGREAVRTAKGSTAVLELDDWSLVEVDERSELELTRRRGGNGIRVDRGRIIVQASPQGSGHLGVSTAELLVSVKGTIFAVSHGTKGSRVSVLEGEVLVKHGGEQRSLLPGEQLGTRRSLSALPLEQEVAWSQDVDRYLGMLKELAALHRDLNGLMEASSRYSTRLLDLAPANAAVYVAVPNATAKLAEAYDLVRQRLAASPAFAESWAEFQGSELQLRLDGFVGHLRELAQYLGEETVVTLASSDHRRGDDASPLVLSEINQPAAFRAALEQQLEILAEESAGQGQHAAAQRIRIVEQPADAVAGEISVWLPGDLLVASTSAAELARVESLLGGATNPFIGSEFHRLLSDAYGEGAQFLGAVDLSQLLADADAAELRAVGVANAKHLIVERRQDGQRATTTATLSFEGERQGLASWLAEPGPMGALRFFSPDATVVTAFVVREPGLLFDELLQLAALGEEGGEDVAAEIAEFEAHIGLSLRDDLLATLGGELAAGVDGPALPTPAWKVVVEVYDEARLQQSIGLLVERMNQEAEADGHGYGLALGETQSGGRTFYRLSGTVPEDSPAAVFEEAMELHYTYVDGYLVAAPSQALVERAIQTWESGASLVASAEFQALLPEDGYLDFSGVAFNRLGELLGEFMDRLPGNQALSAEQQQTLDELRAESGPSLYCLYGERDRIRFVSHGANELPLGGFTQLLGLQSVVKGISAATPIARAIRGGRWDDKDSGPKTQGAVVWR